MEPGDRFSITTSDCFAISRNIPRPSGSFRLSVTLFTPSERFRNRTEMSSSVRRSASIPFGP